MRPSEPRPKGSVRPPSHTNNVMFLSPGRDRQNRVLYSGSRYAFSKMITHPKGTRARVLFSSVFGPYALFNDAAITEIYSSELYHNQVTREQGPFSLRMFHRS